MKKALQACAILLLYMGIATLYFGIALLPHLQTRIAGFENDPILFSWIFSWWAFSITHGMNPLWSTYVWAPQGISIANITAIPSLAIPLIPITKWLGAVVSYNLCAIYLSAFSAWSTYFLCHHLTKRRAIAVLGGFLFGFSTYQIGQELGGHLNLLATFLLPIFVLLIYKWLDESLNTKRLIIWFSLCLIIQFGLSRELLLTSTMMGVFAWLLGYIAYPPFRTKLLSLLKPLFLCFLIAIVVTAPYWLAFAKHMATIFYPPPYIILGINTQPLNFIVPTPITWVNIPDIAHHYSQWLYAFYAYQIEDGSYIGLPLLGVFFWYTFRTWKQHGKFFLPLFLLCAILSLGWAFVWGTKLHTYTFMPGFIFYLFPLLSKVMLIRLSVFLWLLVAIVTSYWLAQTSSYPRVKWMIALIGVIFILPTFSLAQRPWYSYPAKTDAVFPAHHTITAFTYPNISSPLLWQVQHHMNFKLTMAYTGALPKTRQIFWLKLINFPTPAYPDLTKIRQQLSATGIWVNGGGLERLKAVMLKLPHNVHLVK